MIFDCIVVEDEEHHVHFVIQDSFEHTNDIVFQRHGRKLEVHLGFLQINHKYQIEMSLSDSLLSFKQTGDGLKVALDDKSVPNIHIKLIKFSKNEKDKNNELVVEFFAHKEKLLKEEITLVNSDNHEDYMKVVFLARVLGRGKGTPMLKNGIHCIEVKEDEESEASDWQGFNRSAEEKQ